MWVISVAPVSDLIESSGNIAFFRANTNEDVTCLVATVNNINVNKLSNALFIKLLTAVAVSIDNIEWELAVFSVPFAKFSILGCLSEAFETFFSRE